ncbi:MAG: metal ABC transporter substrate-binding protein [Oscillatoriales cyanobacterium]|nr:MAG: metal ABC transporter substrate-binding protein [Oscillatoriales cyanobacterium]
MEVEALLSNWRWGRSLRWGGVVLLLSWLCVGCGTGRSGRSPQPKVITTSTILLDLTERVGGDEVTVVGLLRPGDDPHIYEPVPRDTVLIEQADLILYNGYHLEPGLIKLIESANLRGAAVPIGEVVKPLALTKAGALVPDPHVWGDARNAIAMVAAIRDRLSQLSPSDRAEFAANAAQLTARLERLDRWIRQQIQTIPAAKRYLVTTHDAFQYYARAYGIPVLGTLVGISTEEQPSAQTMARISQSIRRSGVKAIFAETTINPALIETVAAESGVPLADQQLYSDSIGARGGPADSYEKMLVTNTRAIVRNLGGIDRPWPAEPTDPTP